VGESDLILAVVIATSLAFAYTNGFHDTANAVATSISTGAMGPYFAVGYAAIFNFIGAFISLEVAATVAQGIVDGSVVTPTVVFGGLAGAIAWNVLTWYYGLPSSSSHALIGGVVGAAIVAEGLAAVHGDGLVRNVAIPALVAPLTAFLVAGFAILVVYRIAGRLRPGPASRGFRAGQVVTGGLLALAHGTADAQKTMGIITLALVAHGDIAPGDFHVPSWVVVSSAAALALGTWSGGWRIIRTMGERVISMNSAQGFAAEGVGSAVILASAHAGFPLSTTQVMAGSIAGSGAGRRLSAVRWGVAGNIALTWVATVPAAALIGAFVYAFTDLFGAGSAVGPIVVGVALLAVGTAVVARRVRRGAAVAGETAEAAEA
jgi:PiT family inorganic phosphate transporter